MSSSFLLALPVAVACLLLLSAPAFAAEPPKVELLKDTCLIQGFEGEDVFQKKPNISYLSGVPEDAEVEIWDMALYNRQRYAPAAGRAASRENTGETPVLPNTGGTPVLPEAGIACRIVKDNRTQGLSALEARFARADRALRVSLRNNMDQPAGEGGSRPQMNSLGWFDFLRGDIFNPSKDAVAVEVRLLGAYAVTDKSLPLSILKTITLKSGWNEFTFTSEEASACLTDPFDATSVEIRVPGTAKATGGTPVLPNTGGTPVLPDTPLVFDNFRMERQFMPKNLAALAKCYDFGVEYLNWPGFVFGSIPYDDQHGYGFTAGTRLTHGGDFHVFNDLLTRDGFYAPATFKTKLANGKYKAVAMTGNYWGRRDVDLNLQIKANGKVVYNRDALPPSDRNKFKFFEERIDHFKPDMDLWGLYEEGTYFRTVAFDTQVADGALTVEFLLPPLPAGERPGGESIWNYLIVWPADKEEAVAPDLKWLAEKVRRIYNKVSHAKFGREFALYNREEVICPDEYLWPDIADARRKALKPSQKETQRGYLHFLRDIHDLVTPDSVPRPDELGDRLATFGAPGQTVQWAVGIYPLKDLSQVSVALGDFKDAAGKTVISRASCEIMLVSYRPMTPVTSNHSEAFNYTGPGVLMPAGPVDMPSQYPRQFWLSLPIPPNTPPGVYRAQAQVNVAGQPASEVQVALRVLPFTLEEPAGVTFAVAHSSTKSFWPGESFPEMDFYKRMGLNTLWAAPAEGTKELLERQAADRGLQVEQASDSKYVNWRWPEDYHDAVIRRLQGQGKPVSFQPVHTGYREGRRVRFTFGFWLWRSTIRHRVIQTQPNACERVYYAHCGHAKFGPCHYLFPSLQREGLLLPGPSWYDVRDGIYDWRYIQTLENLAKAGPAGSPPVQAAADYLGELRDSLNPNLDNYYFRRKRDFNHVDRFGLYDTVWRGQRYALERWELARQIAAVKGAALASTAKPLSAKPAGVIFFKEYFGPFWVDERQGPYLNRDREGTPGLLAESPKTLVGANSATVLATLQYPCDKDWVALLKDSAGKEVARENVGKLRRWKTRWVLQTSHLPVGRYALSIIPADPKVQSDNEVSVPIAVLPGID